MATTPKSVGDRAETLALEHLQRHGLALLCRNYRVARGRGRAAGKSTWSCVSVTALRRCLVEARSRADPTFGGALASVTARASSSAWCCRPPLPGWSGALATVRRFDVVAIDGATVQWVRAAFDA